MRFVFFLLVQMMLVGSLYAEFSSIKRKEILSEAKHVVLQYKLLKQRYEAWNKRKNEEIESFEQRVDEWLSFGEENRYGKQRVKKRKEVFYSELKKRENIFKKERQYLLSRLYGLNKEFYHLFSVALTNKEIFTGKRPLVKDKKKRIQLLREYIKADKLWKHYLVEANKLDSKRRILELKTDNSTKNYRYKLHKLEKKVTKTYRLLNRYKEKVTQISMRYERLYACSISDVKFAKKLLKNLLNYR